MSPTAGSCPTCGADPCACVPVKIGTTRNLLARLKAIRAHSGVPLEVLAVFPGDERDEYRAHATFRAHRTHGEWFRPAPGLLAWVERMRWGAVE